MSEAPRVDGFLQDAEASVVPGVRKYLEAVRTHLEAVHRRTGSGRITNESCSELTDHLVRQLLARATEGASADPRELFSVCAVGGYGREEMSIHSDVDLLLLHAEPLSQASARVAERLQYWLWDSGLAVGCAIRTLAETCELAREDWTVATAILDTRLLAGGAQLPGELRAAVRREVLTEPAQFIETLRTLRQERHAKFGESLYLLQPNVKEGAGGLRDYHGARWALRVWDLELGRLADFGQPGLLTADELTELEQALDFLWLVRNELHLLSERRNDQMGFAQQELVARALGYGEEEGAELPVERFMGAYYRHARVVEWASSLVLDQCLAKVRPPRSPPASRLVEDGFRVVGDHLEIPSLDHLAERQVRLLTAFAVAQDHQVPLSRTALRLVRKGLARVDEGLRSDPEAGRTLLRILASEHRVFRTLTAMNEVGLLGCYLPEWDHIVCRWQHVMYHTYTVDVHTTFLIEELRRLWRGKYERALPELTELMRGLNDRIVLFLGCLFHDVGKGFGGQHSLRGVEITRRCLERLGVEPERAERVLFLVAQHLVMSHVAQRRDLADPRVIVEFARSVGDRENLRNLYLLTFADTRASSPEAWTEWKGRLLRELFERTSEFLETGSDDPSRALEQLEAEVVACQEGARGELRALGMGEERIDAYFAGMPRRYFVGHTPQEVARHALLVSAYTVERAVAISMREFSDGVTELIVCTRDVPGLYAKVAGTLTSRGLNILGSSVYTSRSGLALEVYRISTPRGGEGERRLAWKEFEQALYDVLAGRRDVAEAIRRRLRPVGGPRPPRARPPKVRINNDESDFYTIVDITANDRMGLLYDLTSTLAAHGLEIYISKATTILDQVADTFYLKNRHRKKLTTAARLEALQRDLYRVASEEPGG
ncbi:MAG: [protein-PII] uridylyltransferase [Myxococcota bacterium]